MEKPQAQNEEVDATAPPAAEQQIPESADNGRGGAFRERLESIQAHCVAGQQHPDKLAAGLCGVNSDLMETELYVSDALRKTLESGPTSLATIQETAPAIDLLIRLSKQIAQISQLERQSLTSQQRRNRKQPERKSSKPAPQLD